MAATPNFASSFLYHVFFLAALFLRPVRADIEITGTPAGIVVGIILLLSLIGCCIGGGIFFAKRRKTRGNVPKLYQPPVALHQDQVPMLNPPAQSPFSDAAAVPPGTYQYAQSTVGSHSNVALSAYSQDTYANEQRLGANQNVFSPPPPGPPPVVTV